MDNYNNDYNKDLYTAQSEDFCKSCYSSSKSRAGCLWVLVAAVCLYIVYLVIANFTDSTVSVAVTALLFFAAIGLKTTKKQNNKK